MNAWVAMIVLQMLHVLILLEASDVLVKLATQEMENNVVGISLFY